MTAEWANWNHTGNAL